MTNKWLETLTGPLAQKKRYRQDMARIDALPPVYATAAKAMHRYLTYQAGIVDGDTLITMATDLADLWERAAADGTPVREIVGEDPVEFVETFGRAYEAKHWIDRERARLTDAIGEAERRERR
jgi:DNA-binding ferritin-like protein (Dps family)